MEIGNQKDDVKVWFKNSFERKRRKYIRRTFTRFEDQVSGEK